jgi:hypothetical protein
VKISKHVESIHPSTGETFNFSSQHFCRYLITFPPNSNKNDIIEISGFESHQMNLLISIGYEFETLGLTNLHYNSDSAENAYIKFKYPNKAFIVASFKLSDFGEQDGLFTFKVKKLPLTH